MANVLNEVTEFIQPHAVAVSTDRTLTMSLRDLRRSLRRTQRDLAERLNIQQCAVSKYETRSNMSISKLRDYLRAMGAELELVATFPSRPPVRLKELGS